jgi:hypothetical protein
MFKYAFVCAFVLAGCASSPVLDNAAKLAAAGQAATDATVGYIDATANGYQGYLDGLSFAAQYPLPPPRDAPPPPKGKTRADEGPPRCNVYGLTPLSADARKSADEYFQRLDKTRTFLVQLSNTYAALGALAAYDAKTDVQTKLQGSVSAANGVLRLLNEPTVPDTLVTLVASAAGFFAQHAQEDAVKRASEDLRPVVERVATALKSHRDLFVDVRVEEARVTWEVAATMWCAGLADVRPVFAPLLQDSGLSVVAELPPKDATLQKGVAVILAARAARAHDRLGAGFDRLTASLDALVVEHKKLEADGPVNVGRLAVLTANLEQLAASVSGTDK